MPTSTDTRDLTVTKTGVELVSVGTWDASTGKTRVTAQNLADMIAASLDPHADAAPLKVGHDDDRFQDADGNPPSTRDGEPAYGWVQNLRLSEDGKTLVGDLVGVPKMLADVMETALRRRSVELVRNETVGGKRYSAVLTGLALLGVQAPAVKGLADLRALFADQLAVKPERLSVQIVDDTPPVPQSAPPNTDREPEPSDPSKQGASVMAVEMKLNSMQRKALGIADDATDEEISKKLKELGLKMAEADDTPPVQVTPPVAPAVQQPQAAPPATTPPPADPAPPAQPPVPVQQAPAPPVNPAPAPVQVAPLVVSTDTTPPAAAPPQTVAASAGNPFTAESFASAAAAYGLQVMDKTQFEALAAQAADGAAARAEQVSAHRDQIVRVAMSEGKIAPTTYQHFRAMADKDEQQVVELFKILPAILPTQPIGHAEQYSGGLPGEPDKATVEKNRAAVMDFFHIDPPVAATPKG